MREINKISESLFEKIRDRFEDVSLGDENAKATQNPEDARFFNFDYVVDGRNYGNITLSIIDEISLKIYFSKNISKDLSEEERATWYAFLREMREFAKRNLLSFEPRDITRGTLKHRDIQQVSNADSTYNKDEVVSESRLYGTSRSSYENDGPVRIIIRHSDHINPEQRGSRSRKIRAMYLETAEGERLKLPHNSLRYARAMARHLQEGGSTGDEFGQYITSIAEECGKLRPFKNNVRRRTFEDDETQQMVEAAFEYHGLLNNTLKRMGGRKGYHACKENFHANDSVLLDDFDLGEMRERFVKRVYRDSMDEALPIVQKAYKMKKENKFADMFEQWANNVVEGWDEDEEGNVTQWGAEPINVDDLADLFAEPLPLGVDGANATTAVENIIQNDELSNLLVASAKANPEADARDIIIAWLEENVPAVYQELVNEIGDADTVDQYDEGNTYGASGMDEPNVNEDDAVHTDDILEVIANAIIRRILNDVSKHSELIRKAGPDGIMNAARDVASFHGNMEEIGSSDVSAMVHELYREVGVPYPEQLEEGRMKEVSMDLEELTDEEFKAKYGKTKEEMKQALSEGLTGLQKFGAGAALVGALAGNAYMGQKSIDADPYVQKLEQQYQQVLQASDQAYAQGDMTKVQKLDAMKGKLENAIEDAKASAELGVGSEEEGLKETTDDERKLERYHELVRRGMDPDDAQAQVFNDEDDLEDDDLSEMRRLAGL